MDRAPIRQLVFIHGGETFSSYGDYLKALASWDWNPAKLLEKRWKHHLSDRLPEYEVLHPPMPSKYNAQYEEWKIWFDKVTPFLFDGVVLVGHSLGGLFLAKYLSENDLTVVPRATVLVAAPYDVRAGGFTAPASFDRLIGQGGELHIFHSDDDTVVPFADSQRYREMLPTARMHALKGRGHVLQEEFPELVELVESFG